MKSVLISIKPKWCELIASGKKTIEVRKTRPKLETPFKVYIYCTQGTLADLGTIGQSMYEKRMKVIGEFVCDEIFTLWSGYAGENGDDCLTFDERECYLGFNEDGSNRMGYGWHISDLVIYDKPRELSEFKCAEYQYGRIHLPARPISRVPQSWMYVESEEQKMSKEFIGYENAASGVCRCVRGTSETPSKICLICNCKEFSKSIILRTDVAWLCDRCRNALLKVVESEVANNEN